MKTHPFRRRSGFTLIELLVVIAIIAVLAAAGFGVANIAMKKARVLTARNTVASIEQAINAFYTEYGHLPDPSDNATSDTTINTSSPQGVKLLTILLGKEASSTDIKNPRGLAFLNVPVGKAKKGGLTYVSGNSNVLEGLYDPWGNGYDIILDLDYNEEINDPTTGTGGSSGIIRGKRVAVYTKGDDKVFKADDPKNW